MPTRSARLARPASVRSRRVLLAAVLLVAMLALTLAGCAGGRAARGSHGAPVVSSGQVAGQAVGDGSSPVAGDDQAVQSAVSSSDSIQSDLDGAPSSDDDYIP